MRMETAADGMMITKTLVEPMTMMISMLQLLAVHVVEATLPNKMMKA